MFVVYLLWVTFVAGGLFVGIAAILFMQDNGFSIAVALNALCYLGIALYGLPKLYKFVFKRG
ncbi:MAG: hypothetical protein V2I67_08725 [Thermoanaerobaculales bacterium]|jgi:hypothetical protein|nr:hypothetical protein [Thermoanaerobaculales bacterium]